MTIFMNALHNKSYDPILSLSLKLACCHTNAPSPPRTQRFEFNFVHLAPFGPQSKNLLKCINMLNVSNTMDVN